MNVNEFSSDFLFSSSPQQWRDHAAIPYSGIGYVHIFEGLGGIFSVGSRLTGSL